jgi:hypothetical protein
MRHVLPGALIPTLAVCPVFYFKQKKVPTVAVQSPFWSAMSGYGHQQLEVCCGPDDQLCGQVQHDGGSHHEINLYRLRLVQISSTELLARA